MAATLTELETGATWLLREEAALVLSPDVLRWKIGRREIANVQLMHPWIVKGDAMLELREGRTWWVVDSGSHAPGASTCPARKLPGPESRLNRACDEAMEVGDPQFGDPRKQARHRLALWCDHAVDVEQCPPAGVGGGGG